MKFYPPMLVIILTTGAAQARTTADLLDIDGDGLISAAEAQPATAVAQSTRAANDEINAADKPSSDQHRADDGTGENRG